MYQICILIGIVFILKRILAKKDDKFQNLLQHLQYEENVDKTTLNAILNAYNLLKNTNAPFYTALEYAKKILNQNSNAQENNSTSFSQSVDNVDIDIKLEGQIGLFDDYNTSIQQEQEQLQPKYTAPTPIDLKEIKSISKSESTYNHPQPTIKPKKAIDLDASLIVLVLGVILVQVSAIIFSTTIWDSVDSIFKIGILLGLATINFAQSKIFFTRFETKSPSTAFYILGYTFASFSVICTGYFYVSTDISQIFINPSWLITLAFFGIIVGYFSYLGYKIYNKNPFLWVALFSTNFIIFSLSKAVFVSTDIVLFILSIYAVGFIYVINTEKEKSFNQIILDFSKINLMLVSVIAMTGSIDSSISIVLVLLTCGVLASGFLLSHNTGFKGDTSAVCFCLIMMIGLFKSGFNNGISAGFFMMCFLPAMIFVFKLMNILDEELQDKLNYFTLIFSSCIFMTNTLFSFTISDPSLISLITLSILFISITVLNKSSGIPQFNYIHPLLLTVIVVEFKRLLDFNNILTGSDLSLAITTLLFSIFLLYTFVSKWKLNTVVSQNIFPIAMALICLNTEYKSTLTTLNYTYIIYYIILVMMCYIINTINEKGKTNQSMYATFSVLPSILLLPTIYDLINQNNVKHIHIFSLLVFTIAVMIYYLSRFNVTKKFILPINIIYGLVSLYYSLECLFFTNTNYNLGIILLLISMVALYISQKFTQEDNIILRYIFPFVLVFDLLLAIACNGGTSTELFFLALIGVISIASIIIKPNSTFRLPFNTLIFLNILNTTRLFAENDFNYLLIAVTIICFAYQLYKEYIIDNINSKNNIYIFVLISLLFMIIPSIVISQLSLSLVAISVIYLIKKFPNIIYLKLFLDIHSVLLNLLLLIQVCSRINSDELLLTIFSSCISLIALMLICNNSKTKSNFSFGIGTFLLYLILMENMSDLLLNNSLLSREFNLTITVFILNISLYLSKYINLNAFNIASPKSVLVKEHVPFKFFKYSVNLPISRIDFSSFVGIVGILELLSYGYDCQAYILLSLYFLNFTRRGVEDLFEVSKKFLSDIALLSCSAGSLTLALLTQDLIDIPKLYRTEYEVIICIGFISVLRYLWKEKLHPTTYFVTMVCTILRLFIDVMEYKIVFDAILLGVGIVGLLLYGLHFRRLRVVVLTVTSLLLLVTYISFAFWNNSYWFAYLILTGILLIGLSIRIENIKRKARIENKEE